MNDAKLENIFDKCRRFEAENARLKEHISELERLQEQNGHELDRLRGSSGIALLLAADCAQREHEAARNVADAAVEYDQAKTTYDVSYAYGTLSASVVDQLLTAHGKLRTAAREYSKLKEKENGTDHA
jgi:hypothetical protein